MFLTVRQLRQVIREGVLEAPQELVDEILAWYLPRIRLMYANHAATSLAPKGLHKILAKQTKDIDIAFEQGPKAREVNGKIYLRVDKWAQRKGPRSRKFIDVRLLFADQRGGFFYADADSADDSIGTIEILVENIYLSQYNAFRSQEERNSQEQIDDYLDMIDDQVEQAARTIKHELIHALQKELANQLGIGHDEEVNIARNPGGAPRSLRRGERRRKKKDAALRRKAEDDPALHRKLTYYDPSALEKPYIPKHHLRDVEFQTRITDAINEITDQFGRTKDGERWIEADPDFVVHYIAHRSKIAPMRKDDYKRFKLAAKYVVTYLMKHWNLNKY